MRLVLHNYWRSSASHRVRIGLAIKDLPYEYVAINITQRGQFGDAHRTRNPMQQVPTLEVFEEDGSSRSISQSLPILEYLDERWSAGPPLLPADPWLRARARGLAEIVNSGIQPLQNLSTTNRITELGGEIAGWVRPFIADGLAAFARSAADVAGTYCVGDAPTIADCCLVPQLASARRFGVALESFAQLLEIEARCLALPAFAGAMPDQQPDRPAGA